MQTKYQNWPAKKNVENNFSGNFEGFFLKFFEWPSKNFTHTILIYENCLVSFFAKFFVSLCHKII